jgi:outer membrane protein assembly factor BamB
MTVTRFCILFAVVLGSILCTPSAVQAQEWTRFRGPNGTGISAATTIPTQFTETDYNWRVQLPGTGHSSPVLWGNRLFVTSAEETGGKRHLLCLNAADGRQLWVRSVTFTPHQRHRFNSFASSTPAVDADNVYTTWISPEAFLVLAYDHAGKELWKTDLGPYQVGHGGAASPVLVGDMLIVRSDNEDDAPSFIVGLDRKTGAIRWKLPRTSKAGSYSTPILYEPKGGKPELIFTSNAHGFTSLDPATGEVNWELGGVFLQRCVGGPVAANGLLFATAGNGAGARQGVAIQPGSKGGPPAKVAYQVPRGIPYVPTPLVIGDLMFLWGDGGVVTCVRAATGEQVWMERIGGNFFGSPVCAGGKIYAISAAGELVVIEASDQFKLVAKNTLGEPSHATPAIANGAMYLRTERHLISVGGKK